MTDASPGRSSERYRRAGASAAVGAASRMSLAIATVISVPLLITYLGTEGYGAWLTIATAATWFVLAQFGTAPSLLNTLAGMRGHEQDRRRVVAVSTAWWLQLGIASVLLVVLVACLVVVPWRQVFGGLDPDLVSQAAIAIAIVWVGAALSLPGSVVNAVFKADQAGYLASAWDAGIGPVRLAGIVIAIALDAGLPGVAVAWAIGPLILSLGAAIHLLTFREPALRPRRSFVDRAVAKGLLSTGTHFTGIAVVALIVSSTDVLVIAAMLGTASVPAYAVPMMAVQLFFALEIAVLDGIWPAYTEAAGRGDVGWIRIAHRRLTVALVGSALVFAVALVFIGRQVIDAWTGPSIAVDGALLMTFAVLVVVQAAQLPNGRLLTALGHVRMNMGLGLVNGIVNITVSVVLAGAIGVIGVAIGTVAGYLVITIPIAIAARRALTILEPVPTAQLTGAVVLAEEMA